MRVLVAWGSKAGGTEEIGRIIAEELGLRGLAVTALPAARVGDVSGFDAAIIGGAVYANLWHAEAARLVRRRIAALRHMPVYLFSSGPLDISAESLDPPLCEEVSVLAERVGALAHRAFGGRLRPDARGFPASAMAKTRAGDWRNLERVRSWAAELADELKTARSGVAHEPEAAALWRILAYASLGWALCAAAMGGLMAIVGTGWALALHLIAAPVIFFLLARAYFHPRGARPPFETALWFTGIVVGLDAVVVAGLALKNFEMFLSPIGTWLPFALIFAVTLLAGKMRLMTSQHKTGAAQPV